MQLLAIDSDGQVKLNVITDS